MENTETAHSDYIVYVDESGDHSLESINPRYPLFVLAFCVFKKDHYAQKVIPAMSTLKIETFGHELMVARPIGLSLLRPEQPNRAFAILKKKLYQGDYVERELLVFPIKAKGPKEVLEAQTPVG